MATCSIVSCDVCATVVQIGILVRVEVCWQSHKENYGDDGSYDGYPGLKSAGTRGNMHQPSRHRGRGASFRMGPSHDDHAPQSPHSTGSHHIAHTDSADLPLQVAPAVNANKMCLHNEQHVKTLKLTSGI